tara:strand:+ start:909 stop:1382 length:474 start_codon:yes stop_codon:yes gene_type:complete
MNNKYLNVYNNLIKLTRNKSLYLNLINNETFSDRIIFLLLHMSFFFKVYKKSSPKDVLQNIHDLIFKQIEISIREIGYGDVSINKNMKKYVNFFFDILNKIDSWDSYLLDKKIEILNSIINKPKNISFYTDYFDKLTIFYKNNTLNYFTKEIEEIEI